VDVVNTITETALYSVTIPANTLGTDGIIQQSITGDYLNNSGGNANLTIFVRFGSTLLYTGPANTIGTAASRRSLLIDLKLKATNATNSQVLEIVTRLGNGDTTGSNTTGFQTAFGINTSSEDTTADKVLQVTVQHSSAAATISARRLASHTQVL